MTKRDQVPFSELLTDSRDGEWGESGEAFGHRLCEVIRGTDFANLNDPGIELPQRWVPDHLVERKKLASGDIIFEMAGGTAKQSTGRSALLKQTFFDEHYQHPILCASFCRHLRLNRKRFEPAFVYYLLQALYSAGYMAVFNIQHTGVSRFQYTAFKNHTILDIPSLSIQKKIAAILSAYDDLIENNRRRIALLEKMAEEIYREWFVRMRFPGHEQTKFEKRVPKGWRVVELSEIANEVSKSAKPGTHLSDRYYLPLDLLNTKQMLPADHQDYTEAQSSLVTFEESDILFGAMRPYLHKVAIAPFKGITRTTCFVIRPKNDKAYSYLYLTLFQKSSVDYADMICNGADRPYVVWNRGMERMKLFSPDTVTLEKFEIVAGPILQAIKGKYFLLRNLKQARDSLLGRLISGKLNVENLDIQFPASMAEPGEA